MARLSPRRGNPLLGGNALHHRAKQSAQRTAHPEIRYAYEFNGRTFIGRNIKRVDGRSAHEERVRSTLAQYPAGLQTVCHVNPQSPWEAVLLHGTRAALYSIWFPLLFVAGGFGMIWNALRAGKRHG